MPLSTKEKGTMTVNECNYQAVDESGTVCQGSKALAILNELKELNEDRLREIDDKVDAGGTEIKVRFLQSRVADLEELNAMLVQIVEQLEQETADRVSLLQEGLQRSSRAAHAYMTKVDDCDKDVAVEENEEVPIQTQIKNLKNDITNLLEVIRRLREEHRWDTSGLNFTEVTTDDIFGTQDQISGHLGEAVPDDQVSRTVTVSVKITQSSYPNEVPHPDPAFYQ